MTDRTAITAERLFALGAHVAAEAVADHLDAAAQQFEINTALRVALFVAEAAYESAYFTRTLENLNYSPERLVDEWPHRFPTLGAAAPFGHNAEALADRVYGGRMGNTQPGDGFRYRGRGYFQLTGRDNYTRAGVALGLDLVGSPDLLSAPPGAAASAAWFWSSNGLNALADANDVTALAVANDVAAITRRINGGIGGLAERQALAAKALTIWED